MNALSYSSIRRPTKTIDARIDYIVRDAGFVRPFGYGFCCLVNGDKVASSCVQSLGFFRGPPYVRWFVMPIVVNSVNRVFSRWSCANIGYKRLEVMPSMAHLDAARSVVFECPDGRSFASRDHSFPNVIDRSSRAAVRGEYALRSLGSSLTGKASARLYVAMQQRVAAYRAASAAIASAIPHSVLLIIKASRLIYEQATKALADQIGGSVMQLHDGDYNTLRHTMGVIPCR